MRRRHVVYDHFCDVCGNLIGRTPYAQPIICQLCGKDVCQGCARYICSRLPPAPSSGGLLYGYVGCNHKEEAIICKACTDALKLSLHVAANKKGKK